MGDVLDRYVVRADVPWEDEEGRVLLAFPKSASRIERTVARFLHAPETESLRLDALGSRAWLLADGTRTGHDVAETLREEFGGELAAMEARLREFYMALAARSLLDFSELGEPAKDTFQGFPEDLGYREVTCPKCDTSTRLKGPRHIIYHCPSCHRIIHGRESSGGTGRGDEGQG